MKNLHKLSVTLAIIMKTKVSRRFLGFHTNQTLLLHVKKQIFVWCMMTNEIKLEYGLNNSVCVILFNAYENYVTIVLFTTIYAIAVSSTAQSVQFSTSVCKNFLPLIIFIYYTSLGSCSFCDLLLLLIITSRMY